MVSALIMPRSATTQTRPMAKRRRSRSITGISVVTSAVLPGHISEQTGRPSPSMQHGEDHLTQVRAMILAVAVLAERLAAGAFEVEAGGVHEHQVEPREQVAPMREQPLLDHVLEAARRERRAAVLLLLRQFLARARPSPDRDDADRAPRRRRSVILAPAIRRAVGAADEQPVQHGEEHRALQRKAVLALRPPAPRSRPGSRSPPTAARTPAPARCAGPRS